MDSSSSAFTSSPTSSATTSPSSSSQNRDYDSSDIDELDHRSRKLTSLLKKNVSRAEKRKSVLDVVKDRAWLLEDQVKLLERQTATIRGSLKEKSCIRRVIVFVALILSLILIIHRYFLSSSESS